MVLVVFRVFSANAPEAAAVVFQFFSHRVFDDRYGLLEFRRAFTKVFFKATPAVVVGEMVFPSMMPGIPAVLHNERDNVVFAVWLAVGGKPGDIVN
ncbi:putative protein OS=Bosea thiooxidans OX=53254 GN=SAMN05660750_04082 PE=4 SV=1 [Bosea thiooxidans]|uniref:Uncharacterized protein n=1 Tax=Bosea thiooxidans TaxID=53254 RepID=A0A1T5GIC2_9HYPH|nr:hypothetical protein SAMN05660750_04082 [Bosea thiooxidans]